MWSASRVVTCIYELLGPVNVCDNSPTSVKIPRSICLEDTPGDFLTGLVSDEILLYITSDPDVYMSPPDQKENNVQSC